MHPRFACAVRNASVSFSSRRDWSSTDGHPVPVPAELRPCAPTHRTYGARWCHQKAEGPLPKEPGMPAPVHARHSAAPLRTPPSARSVIRPLEHPLHAGSDTSLLGGTLHGTAAARHMAAAERSSRWSARSGVAHLRRATRYGSQPEMWRRAANATRRRLLVDAVERQRTRPSRPPRLPDEEVELHGPAWAGIIISPNFGTRHGQLGGRCEEQERSASTRLRSRRSRASPRKNRVQKKFRTSH